MSYRSRGAAPALLLSLAAHALVALALCRVQGPGPSRQAVDTRVVETDVSLSLTALPAAHSLPQPTGGGEEQAAEAEFTAIVRDAPLAAGGAEAAAPVVVGRPPGVHPAAGVAAGGRPSPLEAPAAARSVVYVLDRSLSMGPNGALARARKELLISLARLPAGACFQVILYNRQAEPLAAGGRSGYLPADGPTREAVARALVATPAAGNTDHVHALRRGLFLRPDALFLITDGDGLSDAEVLEATRRNGGRTAIHTVDTGPRRADPDSPLRRLAALNGGTYRRLAEGGN